MVCICFVVGFNLVYKWLIVKLICYIYITYQLTIVITFIVIYICIYHYKNRLVVLTTEWLPWLHGLLGTTP